jgi:hypothetical protein
MRSKIHRHRNQELLNRLGNLEGKEPYQLLDDGEAADLRTWSRAEGLKDALGESLDAGDTAGLALAVLRASPAGTIYGRRLVFDAAGGLAAVGPEQPIAKAGSSVFQPVEGGVAPKGSAKVGEQDHFFTRTALGVQARTDFQPDAETPVMRVAEDGEDVEIKPDSGG